MLNPDYKDILSAFNDEEVEYLLVGAYALAIHGVPRATGDMDLWIKPAPENANHVLSALERFGAPTDDITTSDLTSPGFVFQIGVAPRRVDLLTSISGVEFGDAWQRRLVVEVDGVTANVLSRADQIINKLAVGRPQDIADADRLSRLPD